jgi:DNA-directed RNA polymerase subunit RPC12/RpoP
MPTPAKIPEKPFRFKSDRERGHLVTEYLKKGEVRCYYCGKKILIGTLGSGTDISPRCPRCKRDNRIMVL